MAFEHTCSHSLFWLIVARIKLAAASQKYIRITPILVDHSAYDAYMFIFEADGKTIVHTGDFRTHERLGKKLFERIEIAPSGKTVDVLITEGTMMSRLSM